MALVRFGRDGFRANASGRRCGRGRRRRFGERRAEGKPAVLRCEILLPSWGVVPRAEGWGVALGRSGRDGFGANTSGQRCGCGRRRRFGERRMEGMPAALRCEILLPSWGVVPQAGAVGCGGPGCGGAGWRGARCGAAIMHLTD